MRGQAAIRVVGAELGFVAGYGLLGWMALALATPGGYATAIFPPAGLALVATLLKGRSLWAGIWLGAFGLNLWVGHTAAHWVTARSFLVAAGIATSSLLQANLGAAIVRRKVGDPTRLGANWDVLRTLAFGGPLACLTAATGATATLSATGAIPLKAIPVTWFTWWIGDTLGVLVVAPVALMFWPQAGAMWGRHRARVLLPLLTILSLLMALAAHLGRREEARLRDRFEHQVNECALPFQAHLREYEGFVTSLASYIESTPTLQPEPFRAFVKGIVVNAPEFHGLSWCPRVEGAQRDRFESEQAALLGSPFHITERGRGGGLQAAGTRSEYFPVSLIEPRPQNAPALGFDLGSEPLRKATLDRASEFGGVQASVPFRLVQSDDKEGLLLMKAVHAGDGSLRGVVSGVFLVPTIMQGFVDRTREGQLAARIVDHSGPEAGAELLGWTASSPEEGLAARLPVSWAGRRYEVELRPTPDFLAGSIPWQTWALLVMGLLVASLLEAILILVPVPSPEGGDAR